MYKEKEWNSSNTWSVLKFHFRFNRSIALGTGKWRERESKGLKLVTETGRTCNQPWNFLSRNFFFLKRYIRIKLYWHTLWWNGEWMAHESSFLAYERFERGVCLEYAYGICDKTRIKIFILHHLSHISIYMPQNFKKETFQNYIWLKNIYIIYVLRVVKLLKTFALIKILYDLMFKSKLEKPQQYLKNSKRKYITISKHEFPINCFLNL